MFGFAKKSPATAPAPAVHSASSNTYEQEATKPADLDVRAWSSGDQVFAMLADEILVQSTAGPVVSPTSALGVSTVRQCVEIITGALQTMPFHLYQRLDGGGKQIVTDHPAAIIVEDQASPWSSAGDLRRGLTADALLYGSGFGMVIRDSKGNPGEVHRLPPFTTVVLLDGLTTQPIFEYNGAKIDTADMVWITPVIRLENLGAYGPARGFAPIASAANAIGLALALEASSSRIMANGGRPSGTLTTPGKLGNDALTRLKSSWATLMSGTSSGSTAVLEGGTRFEPIAFTSVDQQFQAQREFQVLEIARAFGIPPPFVGDHGRATWANYESSARQLVTFCLMPWVRQYEDSFRRCLLTPAERKGGLYFKCDVDQLEQGDLVARAAAYSTLIASRVMSPNEAREREDLAGYPAGDAFVNPNVIPAKPDIAGVTDDKAAGDNQ